MHRPFIPYEYTREAVHNAWTRWGAKRLLRRAIAKAWINAKQADEILQERDTQRELESRYHKAARKWKPGPK